MNLTSIAILMHARDLYYIQYMKMIVAITIMTSWHYVYCYMCLTSTLCCMKSTVVYNDLYDFGQYHLHYDTRT